jgi:hypothetical protein
MFLRVLGGVGRNGKVVTDGDVNEEGRSEQNQGAMAVPAEVTTPFIVTESKGFAGFEILFHVPTGTDGGNHEGERSVGWGPDEEKGQHARIVEAAAHQEEGSAINVPSVSNGQASPIKEAFPLGSQALREAVPIAGTQCLVCDGSDIAQQKIASACLDADRFGGRDGEDVGIALLLEPVAQLRTVAVDTISDDPANRQLGHLGTFHHASSQLRLGGKGDVIGDMGSLSAWQISAPLFGQVQFAVDEGVAEIRDVGGKDADLAVFDAPSPPAMLRGDAWGVVSTFGEATFVEDQDWER